MGWRDHLQTDDETVILPWVGGRSLQARSGRGWRIEGALPPEHGWYEFKVLVRKAYGWKLVDAFEDILETTVRGYLVGDRLIPDGIRVDPDPARISNCSERVYLIEPGLDRLTRVVAGRVYGEGPLIYKEMDMPLGPEDAVLRAFQDRKASVESIKNVTPALDAAFRMETWQRAETERRRAELERLRREEEARLQEEQRRRELYEKLGDGAGRRRMAAVDFGEAARAALAVADAELLDHRNSARRNEKIVTYRLDGRRYECVCDARTLNILDAGVCLNDYRTGQKGDTWYTLESLPGVIREADRTGQLVVFRRVDDYYNDDD
jgi:hypothetical protein